jgi:hypothetical protein
LAALLALLVAAKGHLLDGAEGVPDQAAGKKSGGTPQDFNNLDLHGSNLIFVSLQGCARLWSSRSRCR